MSWRGRGWSPAASCSPWLAAACSLVAPVKMPRHVAGQACAHVDRALTAEHRAASAGTGQAAHLESEALDQVRAALPLAAEAAGVDTTWQPLDATLSESNRVPLRFLLPALAAQCAGVAG